MVTVFEPNGISIWFKNCHHDHFPFTVKGNRNIVFSVYACQLVKCEHTHDKCISKVHAYRITSLNVLLFVLNVNIRMAETSHQGQAQGGYIQTHCSVVRRKRLGSEAVA